MSRTLINFAYFLFCLMHIECDDFHDRPKIITSDGDLILEPAFDKSIYLLPNGPKSTVYVSGTNAHKTETLKENEQFLPSTNTNFAGNLYGPDEILQRIIRLENLNSILREDIMLNNSRLWRKVNNLNRKVFALQIELPDINKDGCQSQPCEHGGTCLSLLNDHQCLCPTNWEGRRCDTDVNECRYFAGTDLGCQNGATCINQPGSYECLCKPGWYGLHCTRKTIDCSGGDFEICGYGTCVQSNSGDGIKCICNQGWTNNGTRATCLTDVNECETNKVPRCSVNPRVQCINLPGSFRCGRCPSGYEGDGYSCKDIDECVTIPNGGCSPLVSCHNIIGSRICGLCPPGYQGDGVTCTWRGSCNINNGGCHTSANCIDVPGLGWSETQCICPDGMEGDGVGIQGCFIATGFNFTQDCQSNPCGSHGYCHALRTDYTCICFKGYGGAHCNIPKNYCSVNPCLNGGVCRLDDSSVKGYRCECTVQYTGILCQIMSRSCGGILENEEGSIMYPISNTTYNHQSRCAWVIHTVSDKVINITFSKFDLEAESECLFDYLQIHDGRSSASQLIGRFCGSNFPKGGNIISSHNNIYLWFQSDGFVAKKGFALRWTSIQPVCGGELNASTHGHISSPGSPGKYPPNRDCYWHLKTSYGKRIQLHFFALDIEIHPNCSFDFLAIYDGEHTTDPLLIKYCNTIQPAPLQSAGSEILIHFHSDAHDSGEGFQIAYATMEGVPGCGGFFTADKGELSSPSYNGSYLNDILCEYKIKTSVDTRIQIEFKIFILEYSFRCSLDYLKMYDGPSSDSRLVGQFCGTSFLKSYVSSTNNLFLIFKTDRINSYEGFKITYKTLCHVNIFGDVGKVKSSGYPFIRPKNKLCEYVISTTPGKLIQLVFQDFDMGGIGTNDCSYNYVEIRDGPNINSTLLGKYCGGSKHIPPEQTSTHNFMYIKFNSDKSMAGTGFYANYTTTSSECGGIYRETTGLINHPSDAQATYGNMLSCSWILIAPEGFHIVLTWNRFNIENVRNCKNDYVRLIEIDNENNETILGTFCGTHAPPALTTSTNRLKIQFESDISVRFPGFSVSYTFLDNEKYCGGTYVKTHGVIYSPRWPKQYEGYGDCTWIITVPVGKQIRLNISEFDLEYPRHKQCSLGDYLEIRNGASRNTPLIGQYCGRFQSRLIRSTANVLFLYFHSNYYSTGNGFKIEWDGTISGCGGTLTSSTGSISSPNYPNKYYEYAECFYRIVVSPGSRIHISFAELDIEGIHSCIDDYVEIFDGRNSNAASLGRHCIMSLVLTNIETTSNYAFIKFRSDVYRGKHGFLLNYNSVCRTNFTGRYGVIESPDYPNSYPLHLNCLWNITVPKGNKINVTFSHFDIYRSVQYTRKVWNNYRTNSDCEHDFLQIKDAADDYVKPKLCGNIVPPDFTSKSNSLQINFLTDDIPTTGFRLEWVIHGCGGHIQKEYGSIILDKGSISTSELECEWLIETATGKSVLLSFSDLYLSENVNCTIDAIEIYNGPDIKYPLLSRFCHRNSASVKSSDNYILVRLVKHSPLKEVYFQLSFNSQIPSCGGPIESKSGFIYSNNYPKNYDDNLNCIWIISVPTNHRIEINFIDIDLYSPSYYNNFHCSDHIKIFDDMSSNYTHLICANSNITQIITKSNKVQVQFITNSFGSAKGFKAKFTAICGALLTPLNDGIISSDLNIPTKSCIWRIIAPKLEQKISLTITYISLPKSNGIVTNKSCFLAYLRVYDGDDNTAPLIDEYCGRKVPPMIVSHGSAITIELEINGDKITGRFSAHYSTWNNACGGSLTSEEGTIASPNYPRAYPGDIDCEWILNTSPGIRAYITFERFNLELSDRCNEDYLEVREDSGGGKLLGVYCGTEIPVNTTTASRLYIKFHSNKDNNGEGFVIHYGFLHGNEIVGDNGILTSPLYPFPYHGSGEYFWRIMTTGGQTLTLTIDQLEIQSYGSICNNKLSVYDGYDDTAPLLEELCGILNLETKILQTSSSAVYLTLSTDESNTGLLFHIVWAISDKISTDSNSGYIINCGSNNIEIISSTRSQVFHSPNYPNNYRNNLNCQWIFKSTMGNHLNLKFSDFQVEETDGCYADSVSLYSSNTLGQWKPIQEKICVLALSKSVTIISNYLRVTFKTDTAISRKGFQAKVLCMCGGVITNISGTIEPFWQNYYDSISEFNITRCDWRVQVRPGRVIKLQFEHFNITDTNGKCLISVILHNGDSVNAPLLGSGKYCGATHEIKTNIITSSNALFVSYINENTNYISNPNFENFRIRYEEQSVQCGVTANLDPDHRWEIINSPNYPSVPIPYSECIWVFRGPPGEILRIDFIDRFDLDDVDGCVTEAVEIRDGSSEMAPHLGRFCSDNPGSIKSTNNVIYIKYLTQLMEPRNGFKANISIDICGGTIVSRFGELLSPGYPHLQALPYGTVCEWKIIVPPRNTILLKSQDINLPDSEKFCETRIVIQEYIPGNNKKYFLKTFCNDRIKTGSSIETSTNEVMILFYIAKPREWTQVPNPRGFRLTFNSSKQVCGDFITTSEGFLMTPSYPLETTIMYCEWRIKVPNKNRRVRIEILDINVLKHIISIFNDINFQSPIKIIPDNDDNSTNLVFESSTNKLAINVWLNHLVTQHRFKAKFSSEDPILCGGELFGVSGVLKAPDMQRSYTCEWHYNNNDPFIHNTLEYNTIFITVSLNSSVSRTRCHHRDPKLNIKSAANKIGMVFSQELCGNIEVAYRIPSSIVDFKATKNKSSSLFFHLEWVSQPCGGILHAGDTPQNVITLPTSYNGTLECAWIVLVPVNNRVQLYMEGLFKLDCDDEYVKISQGLDPNSPILGEFCRTKLLDTPIITNFKFVFIQYHTKVKNNTDIRVYVKTDKDQCGGYLFSYENVFASPNYPKNYYPNQECSWEINADLSYRISLNFIERFVIEDRINCTKDVLIIYDWKDDEYAEIARLCGRDLPHSYNSTYNKMKVVLRTDFETNLDGFKAKWIPICGGNYIATEKEQFLYSPGFPSDYSPNLSCFYEISAAGKKAVIKFFEFDLEGTYPDCEYDNLTISSGSHTNYNTLIYCGNKLPPTFNSDEITFVFKTDSLYQSTGFKMSYKISLCGGYINTSTDIVSNYFETYDNNLNCTWNIVAPSNKIVILKFFYIDLEVTSDCSNDYISVFDGQGIDSNKRLALMCGYVNSTTVLRSLGNTMLLQFITDAGVQLKGFKAIVFFTYSTGVGCGGVIELRVNSSHILKSPLINDNVVYENYLDCLWTVTSPEDTFIKIEFTSFHIASCRDVNETALGYNQCDCDYIEVTDGINPNSLVIGKYCGDIQPPQLTSSGPMMGFRLLTDGEITSSGFEARLTVQRSICGHSRYILSRELQHLKSPNYDTGSIPAGIHCAYHLVNNFDSEVHLAIKVDLQSPTIKNDGSNICTKDKLVITNIPNKTNITIGKDFIVRSEIDEFFATADFYEFTFPKRFDLCGRKDLIDLYLYGDVYINLITSSHSDDITHRGVEITMIFADNCASDYTAPYGRIKSTYESKDVDRNCYTSITAPANNTISLYFLSVDSYHWNKDCYLDIYDGNDTNSTKLTRYQADFADYYPVFSTGRYILIHNHMADKDNLLSVRLAFDLNYMTTDKGVGCGGKLINEIGTVTSPLYPNTYREISICEWELETPFGTQLLLRFSTFDMGVNCNQNYIKLIDQAGNIKASFCSESPADFTSVNNYVKIAYVTSLNNGGTGWVADFVGIISRR